MPPKAFAVGGLIVALTIFIAIVSGVYYFSLKNPEPVQNPQPTTPPAILVPNPTPRISPQTTLTNPCVNYGHGAACGQKGRPIDYLEPRSCYKNARCELQLNGKCGWTQTPELKACIEKNQLAPAPHPKVNPTPKPTPTPAPSPAPLPATSKPQSFTLAADDSGFYPANTVSVPKGTQVSITFRVKTENVYYGGLDFRSSQFQNASALPGQLASVSFIANNSFLITSYWPNTGQRKADLTIEVK